ncbi:hypothetical protein QBC43DRAFT_263608 [Cladorrhinum sp. PSN259]|nr:hypothetical protein QBC43DRAFT_263608 [Cladorrhinum sp. PSN259]
MSWAAPGIGAFTLAVVLVTLSTVFVALRFVSRRRILNIWGTTDWFMLVTLFFAFASAATVGAFAAHGMGHHVVDLRPDQLPPFVKVIYVAGIVTNTSIALTKLSVLLLLLDIFSVFWYRKATYVVMVLAACYLVWVFVTNIIACLPIQAFWDLSIPESDRWCMPQRPKMLADTTLNAALDIAIFFIPLPLLRTLRLPLKQKLWLCVVFTLGLIVCIASLLRFHFIDFAVLMADPTWASVNISTWANVEINLAIIIACIPTLRPLMAKFCPRLVEPSIEGSDVDGSSPPPTISSPAWRAEMRQQC